MLFHRAGGVTEKTQRRRRRRIHVQHAVVRGQLDGVVRVPGRRRLRLGGRRERVENRTVAAHAEHVVDRRHRAGGRAHVHGVRVGGRVLGAPAPNAVGHRAAAGARGRRAGGRVARPVRGGAVRVRTGHVPRGAVRRRRASVVLAQHGRHVDVLRVLRVPVHRPGRHAHVRADIVEHRAPVPRSQRPDRTEIRGLPEGPGNGGGRGVRDVVTVARLPRRSSTVRHQRRCTDRQQLIRYE